MKTLSDSIPESNIIKNSEVYLDGFTGFTPVQYQVLYMLMKYAKEVSICITIDVKAVRLNVIKEYELFRLSKETVNKLVQIAGEANVDVNQVFFDAGKRIAPI